MYKIQYKFYFSCTDQLVSDISELHQNKSLIETSNSELVILKETIAELTEATNFSADEVSKQLCTLLNSKTGNPETAGISSKLSAMNALLTEVLKVMFIPC